MYGKVVRVVREIIFDEREKIVVDNRMWYVDIL
jgi:hypothetical protein